MGGGAQEAGHHTCENQLPNQVRTYVRICICARMQREWLCSILYVLCMYISIRILCSVCCSIGRNGGVVQLL